MESTPLRLLLLPPLLLLASGCERPSGSGAGSTIDEPGDVGLDHPFDGDAGPFVSYELAPDPVDAAEGAGGDEADPGQDDGGEDDDEGWDAGPPEWLEVGARLHLDITCALLNGPHTKVYEYQGGDRWDEVSGTGYGLFPQFRSCAGASRERFLTWDDTPLLYIFAGGMHHDLFPTTQPDRWLGDVYVDEGTSSHECLDALAEAGLQWPVVMQATVTTIEP